MKAAIFALTSALLVSSGLAQYGSSSSSSSPTSSISDTDILYLAYNLEVLEAQFYSCAVFGKPLSSDLLGGGPTVSATDCVKANLTSAVAPFAEELARDETAHTALLKTALEAAGITVVAPTVDITSSFTAAASAAFNGKNLDPPFVPTANDIFFLHGAFLFEDLGVSAYAGALNSITDPNIRKTAAQIGAAEAYHAALFRTLLFQIIDTVPAYGLTVRQITDAIVAAEVKLAGPPRIKFGVQDDRGAAVANVDLQGLVPTATVQQVLSVVTLGAQKGSGGGFFPKNLEGNIKN